MRLFKEPLLHFLIAGAVLFGVFRMRDPEAGASDRRIIVSAGRIEQLAGTFARTWQRPPAAAELKGLIDDFVVEEMFYREATAMGLDRDDTVIRRRLRQKMEFLAEDTADMVEPGDAQLQEYLERNPDDFREDPQLSFQQVFFNREKLGDGAAKFLESKLAELRDGKVVEGHESLLPPALEGAYLHQLAGTFGRDLAAVLDSLPVGEWQGPVESGFGWHLVLVEDRLPGRLPRLEEIRAAVAREWANERRVEGNRKFIEGLLERYEVEIEWPGEGAAEVSPAAAEGGS